MKLHRPLLYLLLSVFCFFVVYAEPAKAEEPKKAIYLWQPELISSEPNAILAFLKKQSINLLYLGIDTDRPVEQYRKFIGEAGKAGIEVHALGGRPEWALTDYRYRIMNLIDWVKRYNETAMPTEKIRGIHLDIEPYLLREWDTGKDDLLKQWMGNVSAFVEESKKDADLQASADLPIWFDEMKTPGQPGEPFVRLMIRQLDHITLLAYRDSIEGSNGIANVVEQELKQADGLGKPVIIAVNIKKSDQGNHVSFYDKGAAEMKRQLERLPQFLGNHPSFAGVAVHDYVNWKNGTQHGSEPSVKATYVWQAELAVYHADDILSFAKDNGINLLYVRLDLNRPYADYRALVRGAAEAGIEVHALGGQPVWALTDYRYRIMKLVNYVKGYNREAAEEERFRGIHLDIEPYVMPEWQTNRETILEQWMGNIRNFEEEVKKDTDLKTSMDLAFWFDGTTAPKTGMPFNKWMISQVDHVTVLAYRNYADGPGGIVDVVQDELKHASQLGKKIIVCVEMKQNFEGEHVSFFHKGKSEMNRQLELAAKALEQSDSFGGFAVHAYDYWKYGKD